MTDSRCTGEVHPVADLFPMLADDELKDLAADITERGLLQPIVLDSEGRILDGRNRYAACAIAGVEPSFTKYDGDDPDGYALSVNGQRRQMTKGQKAIVAAYFSKFEKFGDQRKAARALGVLDSQVSAAVVIVEYARDLAELVLAGDETFSKALDVAQTRRTEKTVSKAKRARLSEGAPDLLAAVDDQVISLDVAIAELDAREEKARQEAEEREAEQRKEQAKWESNRRAAVNNLNSVLTYLTSNKLTPDQLAEDYDVALDEFDYEDLFFAAKTMNAIAKLRKARR